MQGAARWDGARGGHRRQVLLRVRAGSRFGFRTWTTNGMERCLQQQKDENPLRYHVPVCVLYVVCVVHTPAQPTEWNDVYNFVVENPV